MHALAAPHLHTRTLATVASDAAIKRARWSQGERTAEFLHASRWNSKPSDPNVHHDRRNVQRPPPICKAKKSQAPKKRSLAADVVARRTLPSSRACVSAAAASAATYLAFFGPGPQRVALPRESAWRFTATRRLVAETLPVCPPRLAGGVAMIVSRTVRHTLARSSVPHSCYRTPAYRARRAETQMSKQYARSMTAIRCDAIQ